LIIGGPTLAPFGLSALPVPAWPQTPLLFSSRNLPSAAPHALCSHDPFPPLIHHTLLLCRPGHLHSYTCIHPPSFLLLRLFAGRGSSCCKNPCTPKLSFLLPSLRLPKLGNRDNRGIHTRHHHQSPLRTYRYLCDTAQPTPTTFPSPRQSTHYLSQAYSAPV
jgi:hypothetical protein